MSVKFIFSYLVPPNVDPDETSPKLRGTDVDLTGNLYRMLRGVYDAADNECKTPIRFLPSSDGEQINPVRTSLTNLLQGSSLESCKEIAVKLHRATDKRSGLGLLFVIVGEEDKQHKLVLSRFPVDEGVLADLSDAKLRIEFVERIFLRNSTAYKAALYKGSSIETSFWEGAAVDKQIQGASGAVANYWVKSFLESDLKMTSIAGSKQLATVLRKASSDKNASLQTKRELANAISLVTNLAGRRVSLEGVCEQFALTSETTEVVRRNTNERFMSSEFVLDSSTFRSRAAYRAVKLSNDAVLSAPAEKFKEIFEVEQISAEQVRFSTVGSVVDEKVRATA